MQNRYLDEHLVILLVDRNEHANDIAEQVGSALWHAVEKNGLLQAGLPEFPVLLVQIIFSTDDFGHSTHSLAWSDCNERASQAKECRHMPAFFKNNGAD